MRISDHDDCIAGVPNEIRSEGGKSKYSKSHVLDTLNLSNLSVEESEKPITHSHSGSHSSEVVLHQNAVQGRQLSPLETSP